MTNNNSFNGGHNIGSGNSAGRDQIINITNSQAENQSLNMMLNLFGEVRLQWQC